MSKNSTKNELVDFILNELRKESNMVLISNTHRGFNGHIGDGRVCKLESVTEWIDLRKKLTTKIRNAYYAQRGTPLDGSEEETETQLQNVNDANFSMINQIEDANFSYHVLNSNSSDEELTNLLKIDVSFSGNDSATFSSIDEVEEICTVEWCLRWKIKEDIDKYTDLVMKLGKSDSSFSHLKLQNESKNYPIFDVDPVKFWQDNYTKFPYVARAARALLSATASSTFIERTFSIATNLYSVRRGSLQADYVQNIMLLKMNRLFGTGDRINTDRLPMPVEDFKAIFGEEHPFADVESLIKSFRCFRERPKTTDIEDRH